MSKVYEALQYAHAERDLVIQVRSSDPPSETPAPNRIVTRGMDPRRMEREMARLHQGITALLPQTPKPIIQFIGARVGEGVSTVVWEYGYLIAQKMNKSVLIVSDDPKAMSDSQAVGSESTITLQELLHEKQDLNRAIPKGADLDLYLCGFGRADQFQHEINAPSNDRKKWTEILARFDYILIDSPPLNLWGGSLDYCAKVDGVILIVEAESTRSQIVHHLKERIIEYGGRILGVVFNKQRYYIPDWIYTRL